MTSFLCQLVALLATFFLLAALRAESHFLLQANATGFLHPVTAILKVSQYISKLGLEPSSGPS